ncbi:hypothetical protein CLF_110759 [Clonorchis sinensis]|uniref:Uncharacterized protein n=1 Tax=Clonorchis sinensis TaxID=79923 RepID=G7YTV2_CLOSI|nr:hypothetical protein CLF_110759 [Clonorchis sinensis]
MWCSPGDGQQERLSLKSHALRLMFKQTKGLIWMTFVKWKTSSSCIAVTLTVYMVVLGGRLCRCTGCFQLPSNSPSRRWYLPRSCGSQFYAGRLTNKPF